ncbi:tRNA dihydrouridine synthase DusB [Fulvimarina endophytica]|uniref:tRNA-dihydrouridine synthase n=1 Tax=Fulvimarina endophytica TaxID=2293836 RepID=A0A371XAN8_9HYPH|nr:tRNA dihydrouridine synthase DusB [Fulvimarina endophytica]RFC66296.1 tRNA dihydrouridine synthase DusB [Fulvimarina endophytica]
MMSDIRDTIRIGGLRLSSRVFAAPLSGISDVPFRSLSRRFGAGLVVSEMVASGEFARGAKEGQVRALRDGPGVHTVQLAGREPEWMERAARKLVDDGVDLIDINMGCPAKKVVGGLSGSALMREPDLALRIVEATVRGAGDVPVSLKMRLGWSRDSMNAAEIATRAEAAGVMMLTVHGRTREDFYEGKADWRAIAAVKESVGIPVVANGDLVDERQLPLMLAESRADAVMIGRGMQGRPWLAGLMAGKTDRSSLAAIGAADFVRAHHEAMLSHYGSGAGLRHARKHLGWYLDRLEGTRSLPGSSARKDLMTGTNAADIHRLIQEIFDGSTLADLQYREPTPMSAMSKAA